MFQQMSALASLSDSRNQQRQGQSEKYLVQGMTLLQKAHDEGFKRPLLMQEASGALIEAIKFNRTDIRSYLALAYIFMLIEDHTMAQKYIHQAMLVDPESALVRKIQQRVAEDYQRVSERKQSLRSHPAMQQTSAIQAVEALQQRTSSDFSLVSFDFDAQYDATQSRIRHLLREIMQSGLPSAVSDPRELSILRQKTQKQTQSHEAVLNELKIIDSEIDCSDLLRLLKPIEAHLKRSEQVLMLSQDLIQLKLKMNEDITLVEQICEEARSTTDPEDLEVLEENLEACLDNADGYASTIEQMEARNPILADIQDVYHKLQDRIETYQEVLEEAHARLGA